MRVEDILGRLEKVHPNGERSWMACCPAHADKNPSLSVSEGDSGRVLLRCFAGCETASVVSAMGLKLSDLMGDVEKPGRGKKAVGERAAAKKPVARTKKVVEKKSFSLAGLKPGKVWKLNKKDWAFVRRYDYKNATGAVVYCKLRFREVEGPGKTYLQCVPVDGDLWQFGRSSHGVAEVLYQLPAVLAAAASGGVVWVVEGERDVDTAVRLGLTGTCNTDGAGPGKWSPEFADVLLGCSMVYVIADKDAGVDPEHPEKEYWQGQRHATDIADSLAARGIPHKVFVLPDVDGYSIKDLTDWVTARGVADLPALRVDLEAIAAAAGAWPAVTYRRHAEADTGALNAAQTLLNPQPSGALNLLNAAGGMPSFSADGGAPSPAPSTEGNGAHVGGGAAGLGARGKEDDNNEASIIYLRKRLIEVMTDKDMSGLVKKRGMCGVVCEWLGERGRFYYDINDRGHGTAMWFDAVEKSLHRVRQDYFRSWLARCTAFSREFRDYKMFISAVEDEALVGDETTGIVPRRYWHREGDCIYISCGEGRMVRISAAAVGEVDNGTDGVVFEQGFVLSPWELKPEADSRDPFAACSVFSGISTVDGRGLPLIRLWFAGMFGVTGWKPLLVLSGDVGSGKTRVAVAMFQLLGIVQRVTAIDALGNIRDFWASVDKGGLFCLDNADHHIQWLPDALSVISTGGTFEKKKLYTDTETITQEARCWAVVTSANPTFAADAGLSDRLITVLLERVQRDSAESALTKEIEAARDAGLSWLCHIMRQALADDKPIPKGMNRRHPDWSNWCYRLGRVAGMAKESETAIRENESYKSMFSVQNDAFGRFLLFGVRNGFTGGAADLSQHLAKECEGFDPEFWTDAKIGKALKRLNVALGTLFGYERVNHSGRAVYKFRPLADTANDSDTTVPLGEQQMLGDVGDVRDETVKSLSNTNNHELYSTTPNIPNIPQHNKCEGNSKKERAEGLVGSLSGGAEWDSI